MMSKDDIFDWLCTLPDGADVYVDGGGLTLRCTQEPAAYLEVGGNPEEDSET